MTRLVAFLRAVNVGGHCSIKKEELKDAFVSLGFSNVSTFKQSGNVIFETDQNDRKTSQIIQQKLNQELDCNTIVFLRTIGQLKSLIERDPFNNINEEGTSFLVTFMLNEPEDFALPIKIPKSTAEIVHVEDHEAYSVTRGHGDGGKPNPYIEAKFRTRATTRNFNVIKEITKTYG